MAPPRTVMRQTDDTVSTGLQQLIYTEREYAETLRAADAQVALRLRFCGARNVHSNIVEFLGYMRQLATFHALYAGKLKQLVDDSGATMAQIEAVIADLLLVTRVVYAPLHVRRAQFKEALDAQLKLKSDDAAAILREFLQANKLTTQQFVSLPVKHLHDLVERADIIVGSPTLTLTCDATKKYLTSCEQEAENEAQLIALQAQLRGSALEMDLCGRDLLCRTEVTLSRTSSSEVGVVLDQSTQPLHDVYCLDDGTVFFIEKASLATSHPIGLCINLKNDAVFLEPVPRSVGVNASHPAAIVLAGPSSSLLVSCKPEASVADFHALIDSLTALLVHNDSRTQQLKRGRTVDDLELPDDLKAMLKSPQPPLITFPCFHDDELPGMFWMHNPASVTWQFVELVQFASSVLLFAVSGWRRHHLVHRIDLAEPSASVSEAPRSHDNWSLRLTGDAASTPIEVVSERRTRIDFWYDQMSKTIDAAAQAKKKREEQEARASKAAAVAAAAAEAQAAVAAAATATKSAATPKNGATEVNDDDAFINVRAKKRQRNTTPVASTTTATSATTATPVKEAADIPRAVDDQTEAKVSSTKKRRSAKASPAQGAGEAAERAIAGDGDANEQTQPDAVSTSRSASKRQRTPPVKTPKQRWVRRKTDDPDDEELEATQPGDAGSTEHSEASADEPVDEPVSEPGVVDAPKKSIRIIFTGIEPTPKTFKKINAIPGAVYEENIENATHVIAPKNTLKRTVKLLCGISVCDHILDEKWLDESARLRTCVYERQYCLKDAKAEAKWGFDLVKTMYDTPKDQRRRLFDGRRFYITQHKTILPPVQDLVKIVEQAGGSVATSGPTQDGDLVITSEAAMATAAVAKVVATCERVHSPELILSSILQQRLDLSQHGLSSGGAGATAKTPPRSRGAARS